LQFALTDVKPLGIEIPVVVETIETYLRQRLQLVASEPPGQFADAGGEALDRRYQILRRIGFP
jgi:hypothetical protein